MKRLVLGLVMLAAFVSITGCAGFDDSATDSHVVWDGNGCAFVIQRDISVISASAPAPSFGSANSLTHFHTRTDRVPNLDKPECGPLSQK